MPTARVHDITIYYEIHGAGALLVLIAGLASDHTLFRGLLPALSARYQVIVFDNRGVGQTDKPDAPYSIALMADDTAGLLGALGIDHAHILGVSLGGRIAADLALRYPDKVSSLILVSTALTMTRSRLWRRRLIAWQLRLPQVRGAQPYYAAMRQFEASTGYDVMHRLGEIRVPTLILHGKNDKTAPYQVAVETQTRIAGAHLVTFRGGHIFFIVRQKPFLEAINAFLDHRS